MYTTSISAVQLTKGFIQASIGIGLQDLPFVAELLFRFRYIDVDTTPRFAQNSVDHCTAVKELVESMTLVVKCGS